MIFSCSTMAADGVYFVKIPRNVIINAIRILVITIGTKDASENRTL